QVGDKTEQAEKNKSAPGEKKKGIDPDDPSVVYDEPFVMNSGKKTYNGKAYERTGLWIDPKTTLVLPDKETEVIRVEEENAVLVFLEKWMSHKSHRRESWWPIAAGRSKMGCAVKLEKGELLIGTFGEYCYLEGSNSIRLVVHVPAKVKVVRR